MLFCSLHRIEHSEIKTTLAQNWVSRSRAFTADQFSNDINITSKRIGFNKTCQVSIFYFIFLFFAFSIAFMYLLFTFLPFIPPDIKICVSFMKHQFNHNSWVFFEFRKLSLPYMISFSWWNFSFCLKFIIIIIIFCFCSINTVLVHTLFIKSRKRSKVSAKTAWIWFSNDELLFLLFWLFTSFVWGGENSAFVFRDGFEFRNAKMKKMKEG